MLDGDQNWWISLAFGISILLLYSRSRFDEPARVEKLDYLIVYQPRFHTNGRKFQQAKRAYLALVSTFYIGLCFSPLLAEKIVPDSVDPNDPTFPWAFAAILISLQNVPGIKEVEAQLRGFLHSVANIPHAVRRTVAQLRGAGFNYAKYRPAVHAIGVMRKVPVAEIEKYNLKNNCDLYRDDDILRPWYKVGCLLYTLEENRRDQMNIDALFFDKYSDELESIRAHHAAAYNDVETYLNALLEAPFESGPDIDAAQYRELRRNRDRLYAFIACGLLSHLQTQQEVKNNLRALGFEMNDHQRPGFPIVTLLCYSFIATVIATLVTTLSMLGFQEHLTEDLNIDWKRELADLRIPETNEGLLIWSWKTVIFYFSCIVSSVAARQSYISKREWFKLDAKSRDKPFGHYHGPILLGTFSGWAVLSLIILSDIMSASAAISLYTAMTIAMQAAFHWIPLAILMSGITLFIADSELSGETRAVIYTRPIYFALAMGLMGFIVLRYTAPIVTGIDRKDVIEGAIFEYHMLIGTFIAWFVLMLSWALQLVEQKYQRTRNFAGKRLETSSSRGPQFTLLLQDTDKATAFKPDETNLSDENSIGTGTWKQIPEGTVVLWNRSKPDAPNYWGDLWIVTIEADSAIYEGYHDTNHPRTGTANFVGHVRVRDT